MQEHEIHEHIEELIAQEHRLLDAGERGQLLPEDHKRLAAIEVQLDRYWDLLRQRRARRNAGQDPESAHMRTADVVEHYRQ